MANKYNQVGTIWFGKKNQDGTQQPHTIQFNDGFVHKPGAWYQFHSKKFKEIDLAQKVAKGWVNPDQAEKAAYTISKMPETIIAEIIEVVKEA